MDNRFDETDLEGESVFNIDDDDDDAYWTASLKLKDGFDSQLDIDKVSLLVRLLLPYLSRANVILLTIFDHEGGSLKFVEAGDTLMLYKNCTVVRKAGYTTKKEGLPSYSNIYSVLGVLQEGCFSVESLRLIKHYRGENQ